MKRLHIFLLVVGLLVLGSQVAAQTETHHWYIWLPDDSGTLVATNQNVITLYDPTWKAVATRPISYLDASISLSPDGRTMLVRNEAWEIWDIKTLETVREMPLDPGGISPVWGVDGTTIILRDAGGVSTTVYDSRTGAVVRPIMGPYWGSAWDMIWSPDRSLVAANATKQIILLDPNSGFEVRRFAVPDQDTMSVYTLSWSNNGQQIALSVAREQNTQPQQSTFDYDILLLDVASGSFTTLAHSLPEHTFYILWSNQDSELATITNSEILIFATEDGDLLSRFSRRNGVFAGASYSQFAGQLRVGYSILFDRGLNQGSASNVAQDGINEFNGLIQIVVPVATLDRFAEIAASCNAPALLTSFDTTVQAANAIATQAQALTAQLTALPDDAIPPGCKADLLAIAAALAAGAE